MDPITLAQELIKKPSISPEDGGCQELLATHLQALDFTVEHLPFGPVKNLWADHRNQAQPEAPRFVFAGHTDVVPTGPLDAWQHPPFEAAVVDGVLYGRGAADMKGSLAAMVTATQRFLRAQPRHRGSIGFLITSDEEDAAVDGTAKVMDELDRRGIYIDYCLLGEPTSDTTLGDALRVGRRGSLNGELRLHGLQGHAAYPAKVKNPIHLLAPALTELTLHPWDQGNDTFPPTSFQASNIQAGTGAYNVIPGELSLKFNFRFSTESSPETLKSMTEAILKRHALQFDLHWHLSGLPFITRGGTLIPAVQKVIKEGLGIATCLSTAGGTSDGRFIAPRGTEVVELGPCNASIHKIDEQVRVAELHQLADLYYEILCALLV